MHFPQTLKCGKALRINSIIVFPSKKQEIGHPLELGVEQWRSMLTATNQLLYGDDEIREVLLVQAKMIDPTHRRDR